jgi:hypothetical protein
MVDSYAPTRSKNVIALAISLGAVVIASTPGGLASATSAWSTFALCLNFTVWQLNS